MKPDAFKPCAFCKRAGYVACTATTYRDFPDGRERRRIPYGDGREALRLDPVHNMFDLLPPSRDLFCHDCGTPRNGLHHPGCDVERCPLCLGQAIACPCTSPKEDAPSRKDHRKALREMERRAKKERLTEDRVQRQNQRAEARRIDVQLQAAFAAGERAGREAMRPPTWRAVTLEDPPAGTEGVVWWSRTYGPRIAQREPDGLWWNVNGACTDARWWMPLPDPPEAP